MGAASSQIGRLFLLSVSIEPQERDHARLYKTTSEKVAAWLNFERKASVGETHEAMLFIFFFFFLKTLMFPLALGDRFFDLRSGARSSQGAAS